MNSTKEPKRYAWITGLKTDAAQHYEFLHAHPWPGVNKVNKECHIQNFSINKVEIEGKLYLIAHLEYTGDDFAADMAKMAANEEIQRWWKEDRRMPDPFAPRRRGAENLDRHERSVFPQVNTGYRIPAAVAETPGPATANATRRPFGPPGHG